MLSKETCEKIWHCHREIEAGEKLLTDIKETIAKYRHDPLLPALKDNFGHRADLQLGIPSGDSSHRLFKVSFDLAEPVIRTHIANKKADLARLNEVALLEMGEFDAHSDVALNERPSYIQQVISVAAEAERSRFFSLLKRFEFSVDVERELKRLVEEYG